MLCIISVCVRVLRQVGAVLALAPFLFMRRAVDVREANPGRKPEKNTNRRREIKERR